MSAHAFRRYDPTVGTAMMNAIPHHADIGIVTSAPDLASETAPNGRTPIAPNRKTQAMTEMESYFVNIGLASTR